MGAPPTIPGNAALRFEARRGSPATPSSTPTTPLPPGPRLMRCHIGPLLGRTCEGRRRRGVGSPPSTPLPPFKVELLEVKEKSGFSLF